jgi:hypothetical protein
MTTKVQYEKTFGKFVLRLYEKENDKHGYDVLSKDGDMIDFGYVDEPKQAEDFMDNFE